MGIDPEAALARNPRLIHVSVTSFGHTGPRAGQPGYDILSPCRAWATSTPPSRPTSLSPPRTVGIIIAGGTNRIWGRLCDLLGISPEVRDDPCYATNPQRNIHRAEVQAMLTERFVTQPKAYWLERLREADVPSGPIYLLGEALADPQVLALDFIVELEHPVAGLVRSLGSPPTCARARSAIACRRPRWANTPRPCCRKWG